jgi:hypothetical protein
MAFPQDASIDASGFENRNPRSCGAVGRRKWKSRTNSIEGVNHMKRLLLTLFLLGAHVACAYEFKLQFTPPGGAQGVVIAGYLFNGNFVDGNCSYYTVSAGSGRGAHSTKTYHYNTCSWDLFGNLISLSPVPAAPLAPPPLSQTGTETVYSFSGSGSTGLDSRGFGFVNTPSSHYSWQSVSGGYVVIPYSAYTIAATVISDGDYPLDFDGAAVTSSVSGTITPSPGTATVLTTTCADPVAVGATCSVTIIYKPTTIACTYSPYGYAYTRVDLSLVTDAGANINFTQGFTVTGVPICSD